MKKRVQVAKISSALADDYDIVVQAPDGRRHIVHRIALPNMDIVFSEEHLRSLLDKKIADIQMERIIVIDHAPGRIKISENPFELLLE
jgi:pyrrolidone-carboxylate peptidase